MNWSVTVSKATVVTVGYLRCLRCFLFAFECFYVSSFLLSEIIIVWISLLINIYFLLTKETLPIFALLLFRLVHPFRFDFIIVLDVGLDLQQVRPALIRFNKATFLARIVFFVRGLNFLDDVASRLDAVQLVLFLVRMVVLNLLVVDSFDQS